MWGEKTINGEINMLEEDENVRQKKIRTNLMFIVVILNKYLAWTFYIISYKIKESFLVLGTKLTPCL